MPTEPIRSLVSLPATDGNFISALARATENQLRIAVEIMQEREGKDKGRISACKRELRRREKKNG